ncbi:hypothetical protein [Actinomadura xylanilytica]|uniref:hypothetical protein n=1 Tax=Actinomadura xylanilytica TaxID=887459 RepID=UPI00255B18D8|nr:hypothetical protein [Actinomadura xylanilytica]MDL4773797.1 hypothetical protein [Actinomadura xylanilytica]
MVTGKIDVPAVQAELQAISTLMSEIVRMMGPQVWQGGSAGAFTADLQGHNRSLDRMMVQIMKMVSELDHMPMVLTVPEIPRVTPASGRPGVASVSPSGLERLETALNRAADGLPGHGNRVRRLLAVQGPGIAGTAQCARTSDWCRDQARRMRTRVMYALAENQVTPRGPMPAIPDLERFGDREMSDLGRLQALAFAKNLKDPDGPLLNEIGRTLRENAKNQAYLGTFFGNVPAGSIGKLAYTLHRRSGAPLSKDDKALLGAVGTALAALSRKKDGQGALANALGPIGADLPGQALLVKLSAPDVKWSSSVLVDMGKAALRWRQKHPSYAITETVGGKAGDQYTYATNQPNGRWWDAWGLGTSARNGDPKVLNEYDPALTILGRISRQNDRAAARTLVATDLENGFTIKDAEKADALTWLSRGNGGTYASLLVAPDWPDSGAAAGAVIKLATTPEKGHEEEAASNAAEIMKTVAWWNDKGREKVDKLLKKESPPDLFPWFDVVPPQGSGPRWMGHTKQYEAELGSGLVSGLLQMTRMHIPAIADANRTASGTELPSTDPVTHRAYVDISGSDMQSFLRTFAADDRAWAQLAADTQNYRQRLFAWGLRTHSLGDAIVRAGYLEGNLIAAYAKERTSSEEITKKQYEDAQKRLGVLRDITGGIIGASPAGAVPGVTDVYGIGTNLALDKIQYKDFDKKIEQIKAENSTYSDQIYLDLARGYALAHHGNTGDPTINSLLKKEDLSTEDKARVIQWTKQHPFKERTPQTDEVTGLEVLRKAESASDHNIPPS